MLSFYLGMSGALCFGLVLSVQKQERKFYWIMLAVILAADLLTFSRGGYLGIFCAILALAVIFWTRIDARFKKIFLGSALFFIILLAVPNPVSQRFFSIFDLQEGSNFGRIETWKQSLEVARDNLWLGVGIGNYPLEIKATAQYREPIYAHNAYLDIAAETGILNALVWLGILITAGVNFLKKSKDNVFFIGGFLALIIFATHSLVETPIYSSTVLPLFLIIISFSNIIPSVANDGIKTNEKNI
jgi:O-antigen ligase